MTLGTIRTIRRTDAQVIWRKTFLNLMMSVDETLLLKQILEELRIQSQYLYDLRKRLEELERTVVQGAGSAESAIDRKQSR
jgi:hypothetical protein